MSDTKAPALPGPGGDQSGVATPGTTRPGGARTFRPRHVERFRQEGLTEADALREMQRRRTGDTALSTGTVTPDPTLRARPGGPPLAPRPVAPAPATEQAPPPFSPLAGLVEPAPPGGEHPLAPGPTLPNDPVFDLTLGGQPTRVALSELVRGYMRHADYTEKTQQGAAQLRQAQEAHRAFDAARVALEQKLPSVLAQFAGEFDQPIDWVKLATQDPIGYSQKHARWMAFSAAAQEAQNLAALRQREVYGQKEQARREGHLWLCTQLPGWRDDATRAQLQQLQKQELRAVGYSQEEIDAHELLDARQVIILEMARRYRALVTAHPELLREPAEALRPQPPARRGGAQQMQGNGRLDRLPAGEANAADAQRQWDERRDRGETTGRDANEAAIRLMHARRLRGNGAAPLRPTRGG